MVGGVTRKWGTVLKGLRNTALKWQVLWNLEEKTLLIQFTLGEFIFID